MCLLKRKRLHLRIWQLALYVRRHRNLLGIASLKPDANLLMSSDCLCFDNGDGVGRADLLPRDDDSGDERKLCEGVDGPA